MYKDTKSYRKARFSIFMDGTFMFLSMKPIDMLRDKWQVIRVFPVVRVNSDHLHFTTAMRQLTVLSELMAKLTACVH